MDDTAMSKSVVLWYWCHFSLEMDLCDDLEDAVGRTVVMWDYGQGVPVLVESFDGVVLADRAALDKAYDDRIAADRAAREKTERDGVEATKWRVEVECPPSIEKGGVGQWGDFDTEAKARAFADRFSRKTKVWPVKYKVTADS